MSDIPSFVHINEEGPREGFQIEKALIPTERKIALADARSTTGLAQIQVVSFVNPQRVPGMADADAVVAGFTRRPGIRYTGLWLNAAGFERAVATGRLDIKASLSLTASERFLERKQRRSLAENLNQQRIIGLFHSHALPIERGSIMAAFGCNFQGDVPTATVLEQIQHMIDIAAERGSTLKTVSLADTMAWATPRDIKRLVGAVRERYGALQVALHLHDTRGMGIANAYAGLEMGVDIFDSAVGGLGGCPAQSAGFQPPSAPRLQPVIDPPSSTSARRSALVR